MEATLFDDLDNGSATSDAHKPFYALFFDGEGKPREPSDDELLKWLKTSVDFILKENQEWHQEIKNNYKRFKEIQYRNQMYQSRDLPERRSKYAPQYVAPVIRDITDERVARIMEYKPAIAILPHDDEQQDKVDAKIAKRFTKNIEKAQRLDSKFMKLLRLAFVAGEGYIVPEWNPDIGYPMPKSNDQTVFVGDVQLRVLSPLRVLKEITTDDEESNYAHIFDYPYADELKLKYPDKRQDIKADGMATYYDPITMEDKNWAGKVTKITFYHKKHPFLPGGFEVVYTPDKILKRGPLSYNHGKVPVITMTDNENVEEKNGRSYINSIKGMVGYFNNLLNMGIKQMLLMAWPKWFVEAESVNKDELNNDSTVVNIKAGAKAPVLGQGSPTSPQLVEWMKTAMEWVYSWGKSNSVIQGEPPSGVTAFVALQYLSESENRRLNQTVIKFNEVVRLTHELALSICGQFYKPEDERTMLVLGKDNSWTSMQYDPRTLAKPWSVVIQNASALPDSKAARTQYVMDLGKQFPEIFPREQIIEMLDLAQTDKFLDDGAAAARCAEAENEMMIEGEMPPEPIESEFLIDHWRIHLRAMQDIGFKTKASDQTRNLFKEHVQATEYLMTEKAKLSPAFAQLVAALPQFPVFYRQPVLDAQSIQMQAMAAQGMQPGADPSQGMPAPQDGPVPVGEAQPVADNRIPAEMPLM